MEPLFVFCLAVVGYCGYLTVFDLLQDLKVTPAVVMGKAVVQIRAKVASRQRIPGRPLALAFKGRPSEAYRLPRSCGTSTATM